MTWVASTCARCNVRAAGWVHAGSPRLLVCGNCGEPWPGEDLPTPAHTEPAGARARGPAKPDRAETWLAG